MKHIVQHHHRKPARYTQTLSALALLGAALLGCGDEAYAPYVDSEEAPEAFGSARAAVAACEGDDLQYDFNAFAASLAVAIANEMGRWDVLTDFDLSNGRLQLSPTGQTLCKDGCDNVEALLALQDDASSEVPYHSPSIFRSKLAGWYQAQDQALVELGTEGTQASGTYRIVSRYSNKRMTVDNGSTADNARVELWDWTPNQGADEWRAEVSGKGHKLINVRSGKCMESSGWDGSQVVQRTCSGASAQVFEFKDIDGGFAGILNSAGRALSVENWQTGNDTRVVPSAWNQHETNKAWRLEQVGSYQYQDQNLIQPGMYALVPRHSGKPLTVLNASLASGAAVVQGAGSSGEDSQHWYAQKSGDRYQLVNRHSGMCMAALGGWSSEAVGQRPCANVEAQKFQFERINAQGEAYYGIRGPYGKVLKIKDYRLTAGASVALMSSDFGEYSGQFRFDDILGGEPHRLEFSHVTTDGPCGNYHWYDIRQPNGVSLSAPEQTFVQLIFAGGKETLDGRDENPFIAQQVSGTLVAIDPSGYMLAGSSGSSGSCIATDILYDRSGAAGGDCCIRYNGAVGIFRKSSWSSSTFLCR